MKKKETSTIPEDNKILDRGWGSGGGQGGGGGRNLQEGRGNGGTKGVMNNNICSQCKLGNNELFRDIFHPSNIKGIEKPKNNNGQQLCLRYHTLGYCFEVCGYKSGHGQLNDAETILVKTFVETARSAKAVFRNNRGSRRNNNNSNNHNNNHNNKNDGNNNANN